MPTADLRALAGKLGLLKPCPLADLNATDLGGDCPLCAGTGDWLPTESEVRAAIHKAGWPEIGSTTSLRQASIHPYRHGDERYAFAYSDEAAPEDLVLLALLRALEECRA